MARKKIKKGLGEEIIVGKQFYRGKKAQYSSLVVESGKHRVEMSTGFTCVGNMGHRQETYGKSAVSPNVNV